MTKKKAHKPSTEKKVEQKVQVPIDWKIPDTLNSSYSNNMLVQILEHEFRLLFFETKPTPRITTEEPAEEKIRADCVASIIVNPLKLPAFIGVLQRQFEVFLKREGMKLDPSGKIVIASETEQPS